MKTKFIITVLLLLLSAGAFAQNTVPTTFKTVADGSDTYQQQPITVPPMTLKQNGTTIIDSWNPPIINYPLNMNLDYMVAADSDRIHLGGHLYKHHDWDNLDEEYRLMHLFNSGGTADPLVKPANFITPFSVQIHNNFEEWADDGLVWFRDPWFVDGSGDQPDTLLDFGSPHTPTGNENETEAAAFLQQPIQSGLPYYSSNFPVLLDYDRYTQVTTPLQRGQWSLYDIYARNESDADLVRNGQRWDYNSTTRRWEREPYRSADIKFNNDDAEVFAFYKSRWRIFRPSFRG